MKRARALVLALALPLAAGTAHAEEPSMAGAAGRSCVLPGWGQRAQGQKMKGWVFTGLGLALLAGTAYAYTDAADARHDYKKLGAGTSASEFDRADARQKETALVFNVTLLTTAGFWGYNVLDAALASAPDPRLEKAMRDLDDSLGRACR